MFSSIVPIIQIVKKLNSFLNFLILALAVVIGGVFFYFKTHKENQLSFKGKSSELSAQELDRIVNKYIKTTNQEALKSKIMAEKFMTEARQRLAELDRQKKLKQDKENAEIPKERQIRKDNSLDTVVVNSGNSEINDQNAMEEIEKKEYARQWILNARKAGYILELSPELEVIKYTPIRKPSQQDDSTESYPSD